MTNPNPENPPEVQNVAPPPNDNRRRLRELLSIPERDRTDEQWDEIIELEIQLAPGNRISGNESPGNPGRSTMPQGKPGGGNAQKKHRPRTNNNRRSRQNKPPSGGNPA
ncbi:MAG: hypothetical protein F9K30_07605 [Dechloromonas sp.]|nr:MAG: hypothetical protein F9K30_07605 [Dechloromonas sp.]